MRWDDSRGCAFSPGTLLRTNERTLIYGGKLNVSRAQVYVTIQCSVQPTQKFELLANLFKGVKVYLRQHRKKQTEKEKERDERSDLCCYSSTSLLYAEKYTYYDELKTIRKRTYQYRKSPDEK